ncbi:F0F1 ATP synthase subunit epsilon [Mycoplasma sp. HU2014]|uniref:F0F1 ATP synthase subunit epsilon n=1 Tax=Mycoplasma sp. HU2014 TaxID=1664275 RepID=UPI00067CDD4B|nr:F0F1 ATP synthase subunit epsilon [Mycoplasma sp. HU2014]KNG79303.1 F0F1 ATP synthase subunit epsilon [Mycoplasma sp. HU2014]
MSIKLKIITPNGIFIDGKKVDIINVKTIDGDMGILANMPPFVTALKISDLNFKVNSQPTHIHVSGGLMTVSQQECKIITENLYLVDENGIRLETPSKID